MKEEFITHSSQNKGAWHAASCHARPHRASRGVGVGMRVSQEAGGARGKAWPRAFAVEGMGEAEQAHLNKFKVG